MNAPPSVHPTDQTLSDYGLGKLDDASAGAVHVHLEGCEPCRRRASEMTSDSFLGRFRDGQPSARSVLGGGPMPTQSVGGLDLHAPDSLPPGLAGHADYEVVRELGRGGMGVVYLAEEHAHGPHGGPQGHRPESHRATRGARPVPPRDPRRRAAAAPEHRRGLPRVPDRGEGLVFAMEHVDGFDLSKMVKTRGPLPVAHACLFAHQAALGLQHAHEEGMVHRDIKPGNLMVSRRGDKAVVKILDFGLAKATSEGQLDAGLTHEGPDARHARLHRAGADRRRADGRHPGGHLQPRMHALLPAERRPSVPRREPLRPVPGAPLDRREAAELRPRRGADRAWPRSWRR